jgi:hypothetical protein
MEDKKPVIEPDMVSLIEPLEDGAEDIIHQPVVTISLPAELLYRMAWFCKYNPNQHAQ